MTHATISKTKAAKEGTWLWRLATLEGFCRLVRDSLTHDAELCMACRGNTGNALERTLLPDAVSTMGEVPLVLLDMGMGHYSSHPLSAPPVAVATGCMEVSSTTSGPSCTLYRLQSAPVFSALRCEIGSLQEPTHAGQLLFILENSSPGFSPT